MSEAESFDLNRALRAEGFVQAHALQRPQLQALFAVTLWAYIAQAEVEPCAGS
jgi:hypothetical protein